MKTKIVPSDKLPKCRYCGQPMFECVTKSAAFFRCGKCGAQTPVVYRDVNMDISDPKESCIETEQSMMLRAIKIATKTEGAFEWHDFTSFDELPEGEDILIAGQDCMENAVYIVAFRTMEGELIIPGTSFTIREGLFNKTRYTLLCDPFQEVTEI